MLNFGVLVLLEDQVLSLLEAVSLTESSNLSNIYIFFSGYKGFHGHSIGEVKPVAKCT